MIVISSSIVQHEQAAKLDVRVRDKILTSPLYTIPLPENTPVPTQNGQHSALELLGYLVEFN